MTNFKNLRPLEKRRARQRLTYLNKHGRKGYQEAGRRGGKNNPRKFTSETARAAAIKSWETRRAREAAERTKQNENGLSTNDKN